MFCMQNLVSQESFFLFLFMDSILRFKQKFTLTYKILSNMLHTTNAMRACVEGKFFSFTISSQYNIVSSLPIFLFLLIVPGSN